MYSFIKFLFQNKIKNIFLRTTTGIFLIFMINCFFSTSCLSDEIKKTSLMDRGILLYEQGNYDNSIKIFTEALKISPNDGELYFNRGVAWYAKGDIDRAIDDYSNALELNQFLIKAYQNRATAWISKGNFDIAIKDYNSALKLDPNFSMAYCGIGDAWAKKGNLGDCKILKYRL